MAGDARVLRLERNLGFAGRLQRRRGGDHGAAAVLPQPRRAARARAASTRCAPPPTRTRTGARGRRSSRCPGGAEVNTSGGEVHWLGVGWSGGYGEPVGDGGAATARSASPRAPRSSCAAGRGTPRAASTPTTSCTARTSTCRCGCGSRAGRSGSRARPRSSTTTSSRRASRSGSCSSATAGRPCSAPTRGRCWRRCCRRCCWPSSRSSPPPRAAAGWGRSCARRPPCCAGCRSCCAAAPAVQAAATVSAREFAGALTAGLDSPFLGAVARAAPARRRAGRLLAARARRAAVRVGLDLLFLVPGETGGRETYARELVRGLAAERPDLELIAFVNRETAAARLRVLERRGARSIEVGSSGVARGSWAFGELWRLPRAARGLDVLHSVANFGPLHSARARRARARADRPRRAVAAAARGGADRDAARDERARHRRRAARRPRDHRSRTRRRPTSSASCGCPRGASRSCPNGVTPPPAPPPAPADVGQGARPLALSVASDLPHKNLGGARRRARARPGRRAPRARVRGPRDRHRRAARARGRARRGRRRAAARRGRARPARGALRRRRARA